MTNGKRGEKFKQAGQGWQDNFKPETLKFLFYPANPVQPVNNPRLSRVHV